MSMALPPRCQQGARPLLGIAFLLGACGPQSTPMQGVDGATYDVIAVQHVVGALPGFVVPDARTALVIQYWAFTSSADSLAIEAAAVAASLAPVLVTTSDTVVAVQQTSPVLARWTGIVRGQQWLFDVDRVMRLPSAKTLHREK